MLVVVTATDISSRDDMKVAHPRSSETAQPSVPPIPGVTLTAKPLTTGPCVPTSLSVPTISVNTHVLAQGTNSEGEQELPDNPIEVSWWKDGSKPGQPGNAVFAGHSWSKGDGVFDQLSELNNGDVVWVHGTNCELAFQVDTVQRHVPVNLPSTDVEALYATEGPPGLVLITCGDFSGGEYHSRIVVHAHLDE